jgi:hypothetical protein
VDGLQTITLSDKMFGVMTLCVATPREGDPWGVLSPLRGTVWGSLVREVSGRAISHARHGFSTPLMQEIGPHPRHLARQVSDADGMCVLTRPGACLGAGPNCRPGLKVPDCYEPPASSPDVQVLAAAVTLAWRDGKYVVVVVGDEFSLG